MASQILNMLPKDLELEVCKYLLPKVEMNNCFIEMTIFFRAQKCYNKYCFKCIHKLITDLSKGIKPIENNTFITMSMMKHTNSTKYVKVCCNQCNAFNITKKYH